MKIAIISSSVREGRLSHRIALFLQQYITRTKNITTDILDLKEYDFPLFNERLANLRDPADNVKDYATRFKEADGIVIISPVYNASFPAALKNVIDLLVVEWLRKPVLVVSVTYGSTPGISTVQSLQALLLKLGARVAAPTYTVLNAGKDFSENGLPMDASVVERYDAEPVEELIWLIANSEKERQV